MKRYSKLYIPAVLIGFGLILAWAWGCKKEALVYATTSDVNITTYLEEHSDQFSEFRKILTITGTANYLNAYGAYTLFAPNNDAIALYLKDLGKSSVEQVDVAVLKDMVRFHLLEDTISTSSFTDGKLPSLTMYGQYLITSAVNASGVTKTLVNRQAYITQANIVVGNGIIHAIDHVLIPAKYTVAQMIEQNNKYSIFTKALKETGFYDTLNILPANNPDPNRKFLTVLAQSDSVFTSAGFTTYEQLKAKYSNLGDPKNVKDSLHLFVGYHILYGAKYLADIVSAQSHTTLAPLEIITSSLVGTTILINDLTFLGVHEPGAPIARSASDNSASNGVLHSVTQHYYIKQRKPVRVDWDVADFPEMRKLTAYFRKQNYTAFNMTLGKPIVDYDWQVTSMAFGPQYLYGTSGSVTNYALYNDILMLPLGGPNRPAWYTLKTPVIVRGKYKVWAGYRYQKQSSGSVNYNQVLIDDVALPNLLMFTIARPSGTDSELEAQGWKQYTENTTTNFGARLLGVIDIQTTDRHVLKIQNVTGTQNNNNLDIIQFIPINEDQIYPRFKPDGTLIPR